MIAWRSRRFWTMMAALVLCLAAIPYLRRERGGAGPASPAARGKESSPAAAFDRVRTELLQGGQATYDPRGRSLFRYTEPPPTPAQIQQLEDQRKRAAEDAERQRQAQIQQQAAAEAAAKLAAQQAEEAGPQKPQPPEIGFTYIGYMGPREDRVAVLLDRENRVHVVKEGEIVGQRFRVVHIGYSYLEMGWTEFEGSRPIPLRGPAG
jgi:hypothetical protein